MTTLYTLTRLRVAYTARPVCIAMARKGSCFLRAFQVCKIDLPPQKGPQCAVYFYVFPGDEYDVL